MTDPQLGGDDLLLRIRLGTGAKPWRRRSSTPAVPFTRRPVSRQGVPHGPGVPPSRPRAVVTRCGRVPVALSVRLVGSLQCRRRPGRLVRGDYDRVALVAVEPARHSPLQPGHKADRISCASASLIMTLRSSTSRSLTHRGERPVGVSGERTGHARTNPAAEPLNIVASQPRYFDTEHDSRPSPPQYELALDPWHLTCRHQIPRRGSSMMASLSALGQVWPLIIKATMPRS